MKAVLAPTLLLVLAFASTTSAQDAAKEPAELTKARAKYEAELQAATKKIQADHVDRLKALQRKAMTDGDLDAALAIRTELKNISDAKETPRETSTTTGIPEGVAFLEGDWILREGTAAYPLHIDGNGHINWGAWYNPTAKRQGRRIDWVSDRGGVMQTAVITNSNLLEAVSNDGKKKTGPRWERVKKEEPKPEAKPAEKANGNPIFAK